MDTFLAAGNVQHRGAGTCTGEVEGGSTKPEVAGPRMELPGDNDLSTSSSAGWESLP